MPNRRELKIKSPLAPVPDVEADPRLGGIGLDFDVVPSVLDEIGEREWRRLADVYAAYPTRFREGDRAALTAYCAFFSAFERAAGEVTRSGPVVEGRSAKDRGRLVKNPATVAMREAATQLRYWARELGLTPDSRGRAGIREDEPSPAFPAERLLTNPYMSGGQR